MNLFKRMLENMFSTRYLTIVSLMWIGAIAVGFTRLAVFGFDWGLIELLFLSGDVSTYALIMDFTAGGLYGGAYGMLECRYGK